MLVLSRPLHAHRLADRLRQEHGIGCRMVGAVRAVRSRPLHEDDAHLLGHESEDARQRGSQAVGDLRRRPDRRAIGADVSDGARRRKRRVALTRPEIGRGDRRLRGRQSRLERHAGLIAVAERPGRSAVDDRLIAIDDTVAKIALQVVVTRQPAPLGPRRLELARRPDRRPLVGRDDREKTLDANHAHAGQVRNRCLVDRDERGAERRRPDDSRVQHARNAEVLDVTDSGPCTWLGHRGGAGDCPTVE